MNTTRIGESAAWCAVVVFALIIFIVGKGWQSHVGMLCNSSVTAVVLYCNCSIFIVDVEYIVIVIKNADGMKIKTCPPPHKLSILFFPCIHILHRGRWTLYVRSPDQQFDLSSAISRVVFQLHPSFAQPTRELTEPPFEVTETGWGEFEASIRIHWKELADEKFTVVSIMSDTIECALSQSVSMVLMMAFVVEDYFT